MKKIQETILKGYSRGHVLELPRNSEILSVRLDKNSQPIVSYIFDVTFQNVIEKSELIIVKNDEFTDGDLGKKNFLMTLHDELGNVFHVFEKKNYNLEALY